jgi:hypothetical protein
MAGSLSNRLDAIRGKRFLADSMLYDKRTLRDAHLLPTKFDAPAPHVGGC